MPYKIQGNCVHKLNADDSMGAVVKCHDTLEQAMAHMKALYANVPDAKTGSAKQESRTAYFSERVDLRESELDAAEFVARGVTLIRPGFSSNADKQGNRRYYPAETLRKAAAVFEGTRAFANHPRKSDDRELPERDVRDIVGYYEHVQAGQDGTLLGDFRVVGKAQEWLWPLVAETKHNPDLVELSINAIGQTRLGEVEGKRAVIVENIPVSNSVDVVTTGAAGGTFSGALLASDGDIWTRDLLEAMDFDEWREARPEFIDQLKAEWRTARDTEAAKDARAEIKKLKDEIAALQESTRADGARLADYQRAESADRLLSECALPHEIRRTLRDDLLKLESEDEMKSLVEAEQIKYKAAPKPPIPIKPSETRVIQVAKPKPVNPATVVLGVSESMLALSGETAEDYKARRLREQTR